MLGYILEVIDSLLLYNNKSINTELPMYISTKYIEPLNEIIIQS